MDRKVFKESRKYQRSGKNFKFMETGRGSRVTRAELVPLFRTHNSGKTAVYSVVTKDFIIDLLNAKPQIYHHYHDPLWPSTIN